MKKNTLILILAMTTLTSLGYGYYQKQAADEARLHAIQMKEEAEMQRLIAEQNMALAKRNEAIARENAMEAERHRQMAERKK